MTRAQALAWLAQRFGFLYQKAGRTSLDDATGFGPVLDDVWSALGLASADPIPTTSADRFRAVAKFLAYWHVCNFLVTRYSKSLAGVSLQTYQVFQGAKAMLDEARKEAAAYGFGGQHASYAEVILRPQRSEQRRYIGGMTEYG